ncbi:MAG: glycosyltransferase family 2 protein [Magnetococcales bacterium]|nr:glycosyltransferase family 2 protein [Magnetococcales bacterium]
MDPEIQLSIVIPVYHSETCLEPLLARIHQALEPERIAFEVILVNDGSRDGSWRVIAALCARHAHVIGVNHRRNFGQDNAIMTGLRLARGLFVATMDDDLQHDPADLPRLLAAMRTSDAEVIFGSLEIQTDPGWKRLGRALHARTLEWLLDKPKDFQFTSYRLMRGEVARDIGFYDGAFPFIDALLVQVSTRFEQVPVQVHARFQGRSNYTLLKSLQLWMKLLVSFSIKPLRVVTFLGLFAFVTGVVSATGVVLQKWLSPESFEPNDAGWASLMVVMLIMNGLQMCFIGILGEYVGRSYVLASRRPQAVVAKVINGPAPPR